jgi:hypothetical protein
MRRSEHPVTKRRKADYWKNWYSKPEHKEWARKHAADRRKTPVGRALMLHTAAKNRASKLNVPFNITPERVILAVTNGRCEATNIPFDLLVTNNARMNPWAPSIDRIDSTKGYTMDNVQIVCWAYNAAKNQWGLEILHMLVNAIATENTR